MYKTYILHSSTTGKFYTGHCSDLTQRINQHNSGINISTRAGIPWKIVYSFQFDSRSEAMALENKIKKRGAGRFLSDLKIIVG
jgi:putative endonuclease